MIENHTALHKVERPLLGCSIGRQPRRKRGLTATIVFGHLYRTICNNLVEGKRIAGNSVMLASSRLGVITVTPERQHVKASRSL